VKAVEEHQIAFEQKEHDYLLWGCSRSGFATSSSGAPAGCFFFF
jgi:hypothetical protein